MLRTPTLLIAVFPLVVGVLGQARSSNSSICDFYTSALFQTNNAANQLKVLSGLVNTALVGSYNSSGAKNASVHVPGVLTAGDVNGTKVNLLPYFNGGLKSSNRDGNAVAINFLDDGGASSLMMNKPSYGQSSNQFKLMTHLYSYFGVLLGCTQIGQSGLPAYNGSNSQASVHKFMNLDSNQVGYFVSQVGLAASSFGVSETDVNSIANSLTQTFGYKCSMPTVVDYTQGPQLQSICQADSCPSSPNGGGNCALYGTNPGLPMVANGTLAMGQGTNVSTAATNGSSGPASTAKPAPLPNPGKTSAAPPVAWTQVPLALLLVSIAMLTLGL